MKEMDLNRIEREIGYTLWKENTNVKSPGMESSQEDSQSDVILKLNLLLKTCRTHKKCPLCEKKNLGGSTYKDTMKGI